MLRDIKDGKVRHFPDLTAEPTPDQDQQLEITTEAISDQIG